MNRSESIDERSLVEHDIILWNKWTHTTRENWRIVPAIHSQVYR